MTKLVAPNRAAARKTWAIGFLGGLLRGALTTGASAALTLNTIFWMMANGFLRR